MLRRLKTGLGHWLRDEAGAVTVDWVVLTAMAVGMTIVVMISISGGVSEFGEDTEAGLTSIDPGFLYD